MNTMILPAVYLALVLLGFLLGIFVIKFFKPAGRRVSAVDASAAIVDLYAMQGVLQRSEEMVKTMQGDKKEAVLYELESARIQCDSALEDLKKGAF